MSNAETESMMPGFLAPAVGQLAGGQPTEVQLRGAAGKGLKRVINLRPESEDHGFDEVAVNADCGLQYAVLPIAGAQDLTRENAERLDALLAEAGDEPTLVHCASGNRVGALMALRAAWLQGASTDDALALGRRWGLTRMEPVVAELLG